MIHRSRWSQLDPCGVLFMICICSSVCTVCVDLCVMAIWAQMGWSLLTKAAGEECSSHPRFQTVCEEAGRLEVSGNRKESWFYRLRLETSHRWATKMCSLCSKLTDLASLLSANEQGSKCIFRSYSYNKLFTVWVQIRGQFSNIFIFETL